MSELTIDRLKEYISDAGESQIKAWRDSIKILQSVAKQLVHADNSLGVNGSIILEFTIPLESRRIDAVLLLNGVVLVIEFKGKLYPSQADVDQTFAYARDLKAYHSECADITVKCFLVMTQGMDYVLTDSGVYIVSPDMLFDFCKDFQQPENPIVNVVRFLSLDSYRPLPSLIKAARELFNSGSLTRIHRAAAETEPTLMDCSTIVHETASKGRRSLILICGVPGSGKTLVGLQLAHAKYLDSLSIERENGEKPSAPAVFLSGNGPLVEVLQYELKSAGGGGKAFVRGVHEYVKTFTRNADRVPPHHILIYDEAQRAFDSAQVQAKHKSLAPEFVGLSEPELFVQFAERVPDWCVVVGLIGSGQEIHIGEEAGLGQWKDAIAKSGSPENWDVFIPDSPEIMDHFTGFPNVSIRKTLELSNTIRFHLASQLYDFVKYLLNGDSEKANQLSQDLERSGYNLRMTHDLDIAKTYLKDRYDQHTDARYGMVASARDKELKDHGIPKGFKSPFEVRPGKYGKWYGEPIGTPGSCTNLESVATEFGAQGLELDACLLGWGTDFIRQGGEWSNQYASKYRDSHRIVDANNLRKNSYRVLLTRGRDCCVIYVPPIEYKIRETYKYLRDCGYKVLEEEYRK